MRRISIRSASPRCDGDDDAEGKKSGHFIDAHMAGVSRSIPSHQRRRHHDQMEAVAVAFVVGQGQLCTRPLEWAVTLLVVVGALRSM